MSPMPKCLKVKYLLGDDGQDNTVTYDFSESRSTYDMSENEILKQGNKTQDQVEAFLDSSFIPKLDVVRFTPIEITIGNGLPYLEAGDCIEAVSEDEITAKSFILEQRISGIQHLVQEAESSGGKLIDGTEEEY